MKSDNFVILIPVVVFTIHCTKSLSENTKISSKFEHYDRTRENPTGAEVKSEACSVNQTSGVHEDNGQNFNGYKNINRSENVSTDFNGCRIEKPDIRRGINNKISSRRGWEQVHVFFSDKAREDAYQKTEAQDHPYSIVFIVHSKDGGITICSGTLISEGLVLTAAHCVLDIPVVNIDIFGGITINIFKQPIPDPLPEGSQMRMSQTFWPHPKYDPMSPNADYDIALIRIHPKFEITDYVKPINIASNPWDYQGMHKCDLTAFGSVYDEPKESPDDFIRKTQILQVEKPCLCDAKLKRSLGVGATSRYICMRPREDFGICSGDSGGGLICDGELKAVVSISVNLEVYYPCENHTRKVRSEDKSEEATCGGKDTMSIFQDVFSYSTWIKKTAVQSEMMANGGATCDIRHFYRASTISLLNLYITLLTFR